MLGVVSKVPASFFTARSISRLLDVTVTAEAFERLGHDRDGAFRNPVFADGGGEACEPALPFALRRLVEA